VTSRTVRAILDGHDASQVTCPFLVPSAEVFEELWQYCHVTVSYVSRMFLASALLAYGMLQDSVVILIAALLFTSYLPPMLAIGFGLRSRQWRLARQGGLILVVGIAVAITAGVGTALVAGGPLRFTGFGTMPASLLISLAIGVAAGVATGDDVGDRQFIGLAAASQFAKIPVWLGIALVLGWPEADTVWERLSSFLLNLLVMIAAAVGTYALLGLQFRPQPSKPRRLIVVPGEEQEAT
jgi:hypothetical protein